MSTEPPILKAKDPNFPQFLFEYHQGIGKVYVIGLPGTWEDDVWVPALSGTATAFVLAEHCDTHGRFWGFVQTYLRGYRQGRQDQVMKSRTQRTELGYPDGGPKIDTIANARGDYCG